jgi:hypothetical protein
MDSRRLWTKAATGGGGENGLGRHLEHLVPLEAALLFDLHAAILGWLLAAIQPKKAAPAAPVYALYTAQATSVINLELAPARFLFQKV